MPALRRIALVLACLALLASLARSAEPLPVQTVEVEGPSIGRTLKFNVVLPASYEKETDRRYPVLYLLHGLTSNYTHWAKMRVPEYARPLDLIVVMPDAGNSWYVNWAKSEDEDHPANWEDFVIKDLVGHVDANYRTIAAREGRAINGLSMGGYGALMLGLRHPELFGSIGSHSGAIGFAKMIGERLREGKELPNYMRKPTEEPDPAIGIEGFSSQAERTPGGELFATAEQCDAHDPYKLVLKLKPEERPHIYVDCGTEDFLYKDNAEFAKLLLDNKIPFTYAQSPGGHTPQYWAREVGHSMAVQYHILQRLLAHAEREQAEPADER